MKGDKPPFWLDEAAEADLAAIVRYTAKQWGKAQSRTYSDQLYACIDRLARDSTKVRSMDELHPGLKIIKCQHHVVLALPVARAQMRVIAILHERMDVMSRLTRRLNQIDPSK